MQYKKLLLASTLSETAVSINDYLVLMQAVSCTIESKKGCILKLDYFEDKPPI